MTKICKICGKEFIPNTWANGQISPYQVICNDCATYDKLERKKICPVCGKQFTLTRKTVKDKWPNYVYCSIDCSTKVIVNKTCPICGKQFSTSVNREDKPYNKYCSVDCAEKDTVKRKCKICGNVFDCGASINGRHNKQFCDSCRPKEKRRKTIESCMKKYNVVFPCLTPQCIEYNYQANSETNKLLLADNNIQYSTEKSLGHFSYDFCVENNLIEINPTISHTCIDVVPQFSKRESNYHLNKTNFAKENGYRCIHVWDWDDWDKIIQFIKSKQKLYARKLQLKEVDKSVINVFLNKYHIQNSCYGNLINLGLYNNEQLIQVMTFGKPRYNKNYQYELLRLCTCSDYLVVGGVERLFKYFVQNYQPKSVVSYCDVSKFNGNVYTKLDFVLKEQTKPAKIWSKGKEHITDNLLRQQGADRLIGTHDGKGTDNEEIMLREGWLPVYDCGQRVFSWDNKY